MVGLCILFFKHKKCGFEAVKFLLVIINKKKESETNQNFLSF